MNPPPVLTDAPVAGEDKAFFGPPFADPRPLPDLRTPIERVEDLERRLDELVTALDDHREAREALVARLTALGLDLDLPGSGRSAVDAWLLDAAADAPPALGGGVSNLTHAAGGATTAPANGEAVGVVSPVQGDTPRPTDPEGETVPPAPPADGSPGTVAPGGDVPRRSRTRRLGRMLPAVLVTAGILACADAIATVVWQEPVTALWAIREQDVLDGQLDEIERAYVPQQSANGPTALTKADQARAARTERAAISAAATSFSAGLKDGKPFGRIEMPAIGEKAVLLEGTKTDDLRKGPGHYGTTKVPGDGGTIGLAGHRTTYSAPFRKIDQLDNGDEIVMRMPYGVFTYKVFRTRIVRPEQISVLNQVESGERLVLTACHPLYSAKERIVVFARRVSATLRTAKS